MLGVHSTGLKDKCFRMPSGGGGGAGEASVLNSVHYMSRLHIFFLSRLHTLQSSCVAMDTDTRCKQYFSLSYLVKFALYISLHAM